MVTLPDALIEQFVELLDTPSFSDPDANLTYAERKQLKERRYAELAREQLPQIKRKLRWTQVGIGASIALLVLAAAGLGLSIAGVVSVTSDDLAFPLFYAACTGAGAAGSAWRYAALEKKRVIFELVVAAETGAPGAQQHEEAQVESAQQEKAHA